MVVKDDSEITKVQVLELKCQLVDEDLAIDIIGKGGENIRILGTAAQGSYTEEFVNGQNFYALIFMEVKI